MAWERLRHAVEYPLSPQGRAAVNATTPMPHQTLRGLRIGVV
jgi:hypothetical protein